MSDPISALGEVLSRDIERVRTHAENLANMNTVGFRRQVEGTAVDTRTAGNLRATGRPLDIALVGAGWLVESHRDAGLFLTRNGHLTVDAEGFLRSSEGLRLEGSAGPVFVGSAARVQIDVDGQVMADGQVAGRLRLAADPAADAILARLPDGRLQVRAAGETGTARVAAGVLEYAAVELSSEMSRLLMTSRHIESTQRALQIYDRTLDTGINQLGKE